MDDSRGTGAIDSDQFAGYLAMQGLADNTIRNYRAMYHRWCDWAIAHDRNPWRPDPLAVRAWGSTVVGTKSSLAQARATIGHLCDALEVDDVSPAIPLPREPRRQPRGLDHQQAVQLAVTAERCGLKGTAVLVGLYTSGRRAEIASLAWRNVDFGARKITLVRPKTRDRHTIDLSEHLADHLEQRWVAGEQWVFPGRYGGHLAPATIWSYILDVAEAAGVGRVTPHQLRHTSVTEAYEVTGDLVATMQLAGHTRPDVTMGYVALSAERARAAVSALDYRPGGESA